MAWNEPPKDSGDNNPFDTDKSKPAQKPTQNPRPTSQGNNDPLMNLEDTIDKLKEKLMGGNNGGGGLSGGGGSFAPSKKLIFGGGFIALVVWLLTGIYVVDQPERGVVMVFGKFQQETGAGPHWNWPSPIGRVEVVNVDQIRNAEIGYRSNSSIGSNTVSNVNVRSESLMLTRDENIVDVKIAVQYNIKSAQDYLFNVRDPDDTLRHALESALREIVGQNDMDFILTEGRNKVVSLTKDLGQGILNKYESGLQLTSVNLQDAQPPDQVQDAFDDAVKAREDKQRLINEAEAYSNDIVPKARGEASRIIEESIAYKERVIANSEGEAARFDSLYKEYRASPRVTRERLYIDAMQSVLSNSSKVLMTGDSANNLNLLPLDKLIRGGATLGDIQSRIQQNTNGSNPGITGTTTQDGRSRRTR